ncbi:MAG: hypothetical protein WCS99_11390 [Limisphaerales bacterium]
MKSHLFLLAVLCSFLVGCLTPAERLEPAIIAQVKVGQKRSELEGVLGKPKEMETGANNQSVATYSHLTAVPYDNGKLRMLSVLYSDEFVVLQLLFHEGDFKYNLSLFSPDHYGTPFSREFVVNTMKSTRLEEEVVKAFGPPFIRRLNTDGERVLIWIAGREKFVFAPNKHFDTQTLVVICDETGFVRKHTMTGFDEATK